MIIPEYKSCGNWASYDAKNDLSYCGWMDFHHDIDSGATKHKPYFTILVLAVDPDAVLVVQENKKYISIHPRVNDVIKFNATKKHALLPSAIAKECCYKNSTVPQRKLLPISNSSVFDVKQRLVWRFINE